MSTEELAELFLTYLYDLSEAARHPNFLFSVNDFAPRMGITDREQLLNAVNLLESRGFIFLASYDAWGGISAAITMDGAVFVEKGGGTGIIARYREDPQAFVCEAPAEQAPVVPPPITEPIKMASEEKEPFFAGRAIEAILADMEDILERDNSVGVETKRDVLSDLATLRIQLERNVKNKAVIDAILNDLVGVPSIAPLVTGLRCIVEAYFR